MESGDRSEKTTVEEKLDMAQEQKVKTNELYDAIMSIEISTLTPLEAMNELFTLQKKVGELSEN